MSLKLAAGQLRPTGVLRWVPGAELIRTSISSVHVVGDVQQPLVLHEVGEGCVDWLEQIGGNRVLAAEVEYATTFGVDRQRAHQILRELLTTGVMQSRSSTSTDGVALVSMAELEPSSQLWGETGFQMVTLARPADDSAAPSQWEREVDSLRGQVVVFMLTRVLADAAELQFCRLLSQHRVPHLVVGAGPQSARVGPFVPQAGGPCLECDDLARTDAEPAWRAICLHLAMAAEQAPQPANWASMMVLAEAVRQVDAFRNGVMPSSIACVSENSRWGGTWRHHPIMRHHRCECWWPH